MGENNIDNMNIFSNSSSRISNLNELLSHIKEYQDLCQKYKSLPKMERMQLNEKIAEEEALLRRGIKINNEILFQYIIDIKGFAESIGIDYKLIESKLNSIELTIAPVELLENGKLCNYGDFIGIDYSYINFDGNGNFIGFIEPVANFFKHTIIHELLHAISRKGFAYMDSFSEGMTDYFAHKISKATNIISDKYGYIEQIFHMFGTMMGDDLLFEDYVTDMYKMKNLRTFIYSLGISEEEFKNFKNDLDLFLKMKFEQKDNTEEMLILKDRIDCFIFNRIITVYCSFDNEQAKEMMGRFFSDSEETKLDLCRIHYSSTENKTKN